MGKDFSRYHFQGQHDGERVQEVIHRHWFNILTHFIAVFLLTFALLGSLIFVSLLFPELGEKQGRFFLFVENTLFVFLWLYSFLIWIDYYFDVWIITDERIINIEQKGLFVRHTSELKFSNVQDVTTIVQGLIPTVLNYGDVLVQTAAEEERFVFRQVPDPYRIKDRIMRLSQQSADQNIQKMATAIKNAGNA